jgi:uncharacterized protein (TIGR03435 family)
MGFPVSGIRWVRCIQGFVFLAAWILPAQPPQNFEVAVIRPSQVATSSGSSLNLFEGGRLRITNEPVKLLIRLAFQVQNSQIVGGPSWMDSDRYDIEAKSGLPGTILPSQLHPLMESLLIDRFHLKFHWEMRDLQVLALTVAKGGPKLKPASEGEASAANTSGGAHKSQLAATGTSMALLAGYIGNRLGRIVVDKTQLSGSYDFTLLWAPDEGADSPAPPLVTALRDQLGLRLESLKSPTKVLVIDSLERPSEN